RLPGTRAPHHAEGMNPGDKARPRFGAYFETHELTAITSARAERRPCAERPDPPHPGAALHGGSDRDPRTLPQLVAAAGQVGGVGGVAGQADGFVVGRA